MSALYSIRSLLLLLLLAGTLTLTLPALTEGDDTNLTAYEALETFDFPVGILPKGVLGYDLNRSTGDFSAYLSGSCEFSIQNYYQLKYQSTITGRIVTDKLYNLSGVSVKILFFWLNIVEVWRSGDQLYFSVGIASASFGLDEFAESPQCGCGFDCNSLNLADVIDRGNVRLRGVV